MALYQENRADCPPVQILIHLISFWIYKPDVLVRYLAKNYLLSPNHSRIFKNKSSMYSAMLLAI